MPSLRAHEGYLLIDHTNSPGIPADMAEKMAARGWAVSAGSTKLEAATITCAHCQQQLIMNIDRTRDRGYCAKCDHYVCDRCSVPGMCEPFAKLADLVADGKYEQMESSLLLPRRR